MPTIRIDPDIDAHVAAHGRFGESYSDVLRRLLDLPVPDGVTAARTGRTGRPGKLTPLLTAGLLQPGDVLTWYRAQRGETHHATVMADGRLLTADGAEHASPDIAATHLSGGTPTKGWPVWRTADGTILAALRDRAADQ